MPTKRAVVLLSGGLDSTVLLKQVQYEDFDVTALSIDYGQRHSREIASAEAVAVECNVPLIQLQMAAALAPVFALARSSQVGHPFTRGGNVAVPHGHYAAETMKATIVPNRNMMLLSIAGALAESIGAEIVAYAAHAGDHAIYPDCRPEFAAAANHCLQMATGISIYTPFIGITKSDIVRRGISLHAPLGLTYSCYEGRAHEHCGLCGTCVERREAFSEAGVEDPTSYAA